MTQLTMVIDLDQCVGCHSCTVACKQENGVSLRAFWSKVLQIGPNGKYPKLEMYYLPVLCQHCKDPQCAQVCPTGASYKRPDGIVLIDRDKCVGCQYCIMACPYGVRYFDEKEGVVEKCTLCAHKVGVGQKPQCVTQCLAQARIFGDMDDPNSDVSRALKDAGKNVHTLADVGNHPSVRYILSRFPWRS